MEKQHTPQQRHVRPRPQDVTREILRSAEVDLATGVTEHIVMEMVK